PPPVAPVAPVSPEPSPVLREEPIPAPVVTNPEKPVRPRIVSDMEIPPPQPLPSKRDGSRRHRTAAVGVIATALLVLTVLLVAMFSGQSDDNVKTKYTPTTTPPTITT